MKITVKIRGAPPIHIDNVDSIETEDVEIEPSVRGVRVRSTDLDPVVVFPMASNIVVVRKVPR